MDTTTFVPVAERMTEQDRGDALRVLGKAGVEIGEELSNEELLDTLARHYSGQQS